MNNPQTLPGLSVPVSERDHIRGPKDAPLTLLEYGDYECEHCAQVFPVVRAVREHFGDRLRFVFRNFPHSNIHPRASVAAQVAEAAGMQGRFWEMHDMLLEHQSDLADADLTHYALKVGLELYHFQSDLSSERFAERVAADHKGGVDSGVKRTPTFFINGIRRDEKSTEVGELIAALEQTYGL